MLVQEVESGKSVALTRRSQPVAVLIGRQEYVRLASRHRRFSEAYADFTRDINLTFSRFPSRKGVQVRALPPAPRRQKSPAFGDP